MNFSESAPGNKYSYGMENQNQNLEPLLTLADVARRLGVSVAWARDHATRRKPRIPVVRLGGKRALLRFRPQDVNQFIAEHLISDSGEGV